MGSPLYQLYSEAFPHLFSWVRGDVGPWRQVLKDPIMDTGAPDDSLIDSDASPSTPRLHPPWARQTGFTASASTSSPIAIQL